jgi:hypothetical protein
MLDPLFADLRTYLPVFIQKAVAAQSARPVRVPHGPFPIERQRWLGLTVMKHVGFDFEHGRLDVSHHPFCGGVPRDVRITTRYDEADFTKSFMGVLHETGHAKYEQNLPVAWIDQPVGRARSMGIHESQSLLQEMQISRSRPFLEFVAPLVREAFPDLAAADPEAYTADNLYRHYTRVRPDYIRVDADEATYPCHIILRYEIERRLIDLHAGRPRGRAVVCRRKTRAARSRGADRRRSVQRAQPVVGREPVGTGLAFVDHGAHGKRHRRRPLGDRLQAAPRRSLSLKAVNRAFRRSEPRRRV